MARVARIQRDEADGAVDGAVEVLAVVPTDEGLHPRLSTGLGGKALGWPFRAILAGSE